MVQRKQAFTLIELLVVVLIVGILAAVAVPQYQVAVAKSRYATLKILAKSLADAQEIYYLANGKYADKISDLDVDLPGDYLDTSTDSQYFYNWGMCAIERGQAICTNTLSNLSYQLLYTRRAILASYFATCIAFSIESGDASNKVCKNETKKTGTKSTGYTYYRYTK